MKIELSQHDAAVLLKAVRDGWLETNDVDALRPSSEGEEFKGFNFLPWTPCLPNSEATRWQHGQDGARLFGYIDDKQ